MKGWSSRGLAGSAMVVALAGCVSGGGDTAQTADTPATTQVSGIDGVLKYGTASTISVNGSVLSGVTVAASGACTSLVEQSGGTATRRQFTCTPRLDGPANCGTGNSCPAQAAVAVTVSAGTEVIGQTTLAVPNPRVTLNTSYGPVVFELMPTRAPVTVNNFLRYVSEGFYSNTLFHRVMAGFVAQGGGFGLDAVLKATHEPIVLEAPAVTGLSNVTGSVAMARTDPLNSATSQFYVNLADNLALDTGAGGYAVFGAVVEGMNAIRLIEALPTSSVNGQVSFAYVSSATQTR